MNIVVFIFGNGSNLQVIIDVCKINKIKGIVWVVFSNKVDVFGFECVCQVGIVMYMFIVSVFDSCEVYDWELIYEIDMYVFDVVVLVGFMCIFSSVFVFYYVGCLLNIYFFLLLKYFGLYIYCQVLENGDEEYGILVYFVIDELDGGLVILQVKVLVFVGDLEDDIIVCV